MSQDKTEDPQKKSDEILKVDKPWQEGMARSITFILTEDCQLRCKYCYLCGKNNVTKMTFETAKEGIDYVLGHPEIYKEESVIWEFIGGEPFLEIELMDQICDYIKERLFVLKHPWFNSYRFSMATNGLLYDDPRVQKFIEKNRTHLSIGISVDGTPEKHNMQRVFVDGTGSYDEVVKRVPLWLEQFEGAQTKSTIGHSDLPLVKDSVLHLWNLGIKNVPMNCIFEDVWEDGDDDIFQDQLIQLADEILDRELFKLGYNTTLFERHIGFEQTDNQNWCGAGKMVSIDTKGVFHPCTRFAQYSLGHKPEINTGDAEKGSIKIVSVRSLL